MGFFMVVLVPLHPVSEKADIIADMTISTQVPSRPGEFHPEPLTDPYVNLSIHTARATA